MKLLMTCGYQGAIPHPRQWKRTRAHNKALLSNTLVYTFASLTVEHCVIFWNTSSDEKYAKTVKNLIFITSCKDFCLLTTKLDDGSEQCVAHYDVVVETGALLLSSVYSSQQVLCAALSSNELCDSKGGVLHCSEQSSQQCSEGGCLYWHS